MVLQTNELGVVIPPPLSRTFSLKKNRKRKRDNGIGVFEIRATADKNGVGMFAVCNISCGDLIISHEEPIVAASARSNTGNICSSCATPIGTLRKDHIKDYNDIDTVEPLTDVFQGKSGYDDLVFTTSHTRCEECIADVWCSKECARNAHKQHRVFCKSNSLLQKLYEEEEEYAIILRLATKTVALSLSHLNSLSKDKRAPTSQVFWWREYGSHPMWWEVGSNVQRKKDKTLKFCHVLRKALMNSISLNNIDVEESVVQEICSIENVGSILGMLQCNVMEYEYPDPNAQFMEYIFEDSYESIDINESISGSGLYPMLSLANHDCNPNASIEFLQESNRGSMIATRNISAGEEILITYVCNGGLGSGDDPQYFRHFNPTRSWKWLNSIFNDQGQEDELEETLDDHYSNDASENDEDSCDDCQPEHDDGANEQNMLEGSKVEERAKTLFEYGFDCKCNTCLRQRVVDGH